MSEAGTAPTVTGGPSPPKSPLRPTQIAPKETKTQNVCVGRTFAPVHCELGKDVGTKSFVSCVCARARITRQRGTRILFCSSLCAHLGGPDFTRLHRGLGHFHPGAALIVGRGRAMALLCSELQQLQNHTDPRAPAPETRPHPLHRLSLLAS